MPAESQSVTPWWKDKAVYMVLLYLTALACNALGRKYQVALNSEEIAALAVTIIGFIAGHKWKSGNVLVAEIEAKAASPSAPIASPPSTAPAAAAALNAIQP